MAEVPEDILRALADPERLAIAGALARSSQTSAELSEHLDLPVRRVRKHLRRLAGAGIVRPQGDRRTYGLDAEALRRAAERVGPQRDPGLALGALSDEEEVVLRSYFRGGRLTEIPARESKRRIVLERLALEFDVGVRYPEKAVNEMLARFHPDVAALRRYLVDEGFLSREAGEYWRSGGRVEV